ncbi:MAG: 23S rRNA (pseudouridine(1915)-N(3))-methyltransferase RlmH [Bdellovibrionales bacterium]
MKLCLWYVAGAKEAYAEAAEEVLCKKISTLCPLEVTPLKAKSAGRDDADFKRRIESEKILENLKADDFLWLFDERGRMAKDSIEYSKWLVQAVESGKRRVVMVIGGPYGFSEEVKQRASKTVSLSALTMNHHVAKIMAMEQTYRALSIWKNLPYHNV